MYIHIHSHTAYISYFYLQKSLHNMHASTPEYLTSPYHVEIVQAVKKKCGPKYSGRVEDLK